MIRLFAYGTLRDAEYSTALFGHAVPMQPALLAGWMPVFTESGYLTIVESAGESVHGDLLDLDGPDLKIADGWEEVPLYELIPVDVTAAGKHVAAYVYVQPSTSRERAPDGITSKHSRAYVLNQIQSR